MSEKNNGSNGNNGNNNKTEARITCCRRRCNKKFTVIVGKNDGSTRNVQCPFCGIINHFSVDQNGKVHGPAAI